MERHHARCACGTLARLVITKAPFFAVTHPFVCENIDGTPHVVRSKGHMRALLREHNEKTGDHLLSTWLDGGVSKNPQTPKPLRELEDFRRRRKIALRDKVPIEVIPPATEFQTKDHAVAAASARVAVTGGKTRRVGGPLD